MTAHDVMVDQLNQKQQQIGAYQADVANLLTMLNTLRQQEQALILWLSQNPE
jgi:uncharacterized protein Smg (DUF494 family)